MVEVIKTVDGRIEMSTSKVSFIGSIKKEKDRLIITPVGFLPAVEDGDGYKITIGKSKAKRSFQQNDLLWLTYRAEAKALNYGNVGKEMIDPWELYLVDLVKYGDSVLVDVIPEAIDELKEVFRVVIPMGAVEKDGKIYIRADCRTGSSTWDKEKMSKWLEYRLRVLADLGIDLEEITEGIYAGDDRKTETGA